ncbi:MAG: nucleotidyltransferase family protein [Acidimicrobiales bacterium]
MSVLAVVLAAGAGTRFGAGSKLSAPFRGSTVLGASLRTAVEAALDETAVVLTDRPPTTAVPVPPGVTRLVNPRPADGIASSLQVAVARAAERGHVALVVALGDQPLLEPEAWRRVADAVAPPGDERHPPVAPIVFARYGDRRAHPVGLAAEVWPLLPTTGAHGAGELARLRPDLVGEVPCPGNPVDIDTPADLARWSTGRSRAEEGEGSWS